MAGNPLHRRDFLLRPLFGAELPGHAAPEDAAHISSAVVTVRPERAAEVAASIATLPGAEVHGIEGSKIIVVLEAPDSGAIGAALTHIALMDGVFSANMVFEQIDPAGGEDAGRQPGGDAA